MDSIKENFIQIMKEKYELEQKSDLYSFEMVEKKLENQLENQFEKPETSRQAITQKAIKNIIDEV